VGTGPDGIDAHWFAIEFVVREASMPLLERGSRLETGEVRTETVMHAMTQGEMTGEPTMDVEALRINELAVIMIRGAPQEHHARIGWDGDSVHGDLTGGLTWKHLHR
jgi:hypothetical protein